MVCFEQPKEFSAHQLELADAIANHVAAAMARFGALAELEATVRFNEMFTAILGHDLRNPLGAIMAAAQLGLKRGGEDHVLRPLERIMNSGGRMARMIDQLLDFTRVRVGQGIPLRPQPVDLVPVLRQVLDELDVVSPEPRLSLHVRGDAHGTWDGDRLAQVFSNLIGNALEHGANGSLVTVRVDGTAGDRVSIAIHNLGAVPHERLLDLFDPMTGAAARRSQSQGLGLGLYITREIARAHGGSIDVESSEAAGTCFTVWLPRERR
jgi:signal transduction histidine kinase